jgi:methionyl-tRNA formyltransferase
MAIKIVVAGSTERTRVCLESILTNLPGQFEVVGILTPAPKPVGRNQTVELNPFHELAETHKIPVLLIHDRLDTNVQEKLATWQKPDILLVVDFGYLVPDWLLSWPKLAPLNIHPSLLPKWRGSSPGQFCLLYGEKNSAVTLMIMSAGLDSGPILIQEPFTVENTWTQLEYYEKSFELVGRHLPGWLLDFSQDKITAQPQPEESPTPLAARLTKNDSFVSWTDMCQSLDMAAPSAAVASQLTAQTPTQTSPIITAAASAHANLGETIAAACRAFYPWPWVWSWVMTSKGPKRLKIKSLRFDQQLQTWQLDQVQLEGQTLSHWAQIKNGILV